MTTAPVRKEDRTTQELAEDSLYTKAISGMPPRCRSDWNGS